MDLLEVSAVQVSCRSRVEVSCLPRTSHAPIAISGAPLTVLVAGCPSVRVAGGNAGFLGWGVSGRLTLIFILFNFVAAWVASAAR